MSDSRHDVVWLDADAIQVETEKAVLVTNARGAEVWLPKSQLGFYSGGRISVPRWLADQRELEVERHG